MSKILITLFLFFGCFLPLFTPVLLAQENTPHNISNLNINSKTRRTTSFEWEAVEQAKKYEIEIAAIGRADGATKPYQFFVSNAFWEGQLKPGKYSIRLRSYDKRNVPGDWSVGEEFFVKLYAPDPMTPLNQSEIKSNEDEFTEVKFEWNAQPDASFYKFHLEDDSKTFVQDIETNENEVSIKIPVARRYSWRVTGFDNLKNEGENFAEPISFVVFGNKLKSPDVSEPETIYVRKLDWTPVANAERYQYSLYRRIKGRQWQKFADNETTSTSIVFESSWKGGEYKLSVGAHGTYRESSPFHSVIFNVLNGNRSESSEKTAGLRKSLMRTNDWYLNASYLITQIQYKSWNPENDKRAMFSAIGGAGRLGFGYLSDKNPYGFLGIIDYSGFTIGTKNYTYPGIELHGILRRSSGALSEVRSSVGIYYKEIPEIVASTSGSNEEFSLKQLSATGIHGGGEYWYPFSSKIGFQVNGRIYLPMSGKTPTGGKIISSPSYQFGVLGSLKLNNKATGLMGYAYRIDQLNYEVKDPTIKSLGYKVNESSVDGHYLNFLLEVDL